MKKGPWTAEEDKVLMDYVKNNGPRDWSSIQSNGLLPRTGKSCRLRWVNKLRPNLKSGCKFTLEEERAVIDMQARFGNKWARIATFLEGRTDNDVKNFWSTRQKRLARLLQTPLPVRSQRRQKSSPVSSQVSDSEDVLLQNLNSPSIQFIKFTENYVNGKELDYI
ncbi:probable transcription factor MYB58 [Dendrobium catenatum]|uniref:Transcription factor GAMYB n=1 Tax=Dendrobium catenatum TaxID=906689 RepID=A0A2I0V9R6_9ASPA|nr:probable transcription factor MYB58 [Dendrobium catenatum]PKU60151.1 Transcription factor GAMYB [Dendrobium catenatum]